MHFVAMLGLQLPIFYFYDSLITLASALVAILVVGVALLVLHFQPRTAVNITLAGSFVGIGIVVMHYLGMSGMELCRPAYNPMGIAISIVSSVALSNLAIWVAYSRRTHGRILLGTVCYGISVFAVHFVAMWQTGFYLNDQANVVGPALSNEVLAIGVAFTAFVISGAFLLTGITFIQPGTEPNVSDEPSEPLEEPAQVVPVPYEKDGRTQFTDRSAIAAVRAEGHYTILYIGDEKLFCPWSISEAEDRLGHHFIRAHRSYLINPSFVTEFRRTKDTGVCYFEKVDSLLKIPVSRSRLPFVREALGL